MPHLGSEVMLMIAEADRYIKNTHFDLFHLERVMPVAEAIISAHMNK